MPSTNAAALVTRPVLQAQALYVLAADNDSRLLGASPRASCKELGRAVHECLPSHYQADWPIAIALLVTLTLAGVCIINQNGTTTSVLPAQDEGASSTIDTSSNIYLHIFRAQLKQGFAW